MQNRLQKQQQKQARTINNQYNIFDFLKSNIPETPELRFDGTTVEQYNQWSKKDKSKIKRSNGYRQARGF